MTIRNNQPHRSLAPTATGLRRVVYFIAAGLFLILGVAGVVLPGLPTTPFLLLTSYFLLRSSPALNKRLLNSRFLGPLLRDWDEHRGIRPAVKMRAVLLVIILLSASIGLGGLSTPVNAAILSLGGIGVIVILRLPTIDAREPAADEAPVTAAPHRRPDKSYDGKLSRAIDRAG